MMIIDDHIPSDVTEFSEGTSFAMFNFDFIPAAEIPFIDIPVDWLNFGDPDEQIQSLGFESTSTFVNNFSLVVTFI